MLRWKTGVVAAAFVLGSLSLNAGAADYDRELSERGMTFAWKVDGDQLAVKLSARTTGWVGIGFNPSEQMKGASFILGYVKGGEVTLVDHFGDEVTGHSADDKMGGGENFTLVGGDEKGKMTTIEFTVPLTAGDDYDSTLDVNGETVVLLAYGGGRDSFRSKHRYRGTFSVNLGSGEFKEM